MVLAEHERPPRGWDVEVLASDVDSSVSAHAQAGIYPMVRVEGLSQARLEAFFQKARGRQQGKMRVRDVLRRLTRFRLLNLMDGFAVEQRDVFFCRNVLIYFDKETKRRLVEKFADALVDGGHKRHLEAKIVGDGRMMDSLSDVGEKNIAFVCEYPDVEGIPLRSEDVGDLYPRKLVFFPATGKVLMKRSKRLHKDTILQREKYYRSEIIQRPVSGSVELF